MKYTDGRPGGLILTMKHGRKGRMFIEDRECTVFYMATNPARPGQWDESHCIAVCYPVEKRTWPGMFLMHSLGQITWED